MKISDKEIQNILAEVEAELAPLLRSERSKLSKAVGEDSVGSASPMGEESRSPGRDLMPEERSSAGGPEASVSAAGSPEGSVGMAPEGSAGSPEGAPEGSAGAGGEGDVQALAAEYAKLAPEELEMHLLAIEAAMQQMQGGAGGPEAGGMPPAGGPAPASQAGSMPPPEGSPAMKSEHGKMKKLLGPFGTPEQHEEWTKGSKKGKEESGDSEGSSSGSPAPKKDKEESISKSELDEVNAKLDVALKAVEFLTRPMRKAVTEFVGETTKPASSLTKGEVTAKLKSVTASPTLAKSDRHLINGFYDGAVSLDQIAHLLK